MLRYDWYQNITPVPIIRSDSMRALRDGGIALYRVTLESWRIIEVVRSSTILGVTATEFTSPKIGPIGATANPDTPKPATHNELQPRLVALRKKLPTLHTLLIYSDVF